MARRIPATRDDLSADVAELIHAIGHRVRIELRADLAGTGVTWAQMRALRIVAQAGQAGQAVQTGGDRARSGDEPSLEPSVDPSLAPPLTGGAVTMSGLADRLRIARRSATSLVDELEQRGLVRRVDVTCDRRATALEITDDGSAMLRTLDARRRVAAATVLAPLTAAELDAVRVALTKAAQ